jgi:hypothetical protein
VDFYVPSDEVGAAKSDNRIAKIGAVVETPAPRIHHLYALTTCGLKSVSGEPLPLP